MPRDAAAGDGGGCLPMPIIAVEAALSVIDASISVAAFVQQEFTGTISNMDGLGKRVDLCHQTNDEDEEDTRSHHEALLDRTENKPGIRAVDVRRRCCPGVQLGSRQKFVILVLLLSFVVTIAFAILIWIGRGENPINSSLLKRVYLDVFSVVVFVLGGALACYGAILFSKMSKVRSETGSSEKRKVASLAAVSLICFSSSAILALVTNVPVLVYWYSTDADIIINAVILFMYYFIGSSIPSGFVLWVMKDIPHRQIIERPTHSTRVVTLFRERPPTTQDPQWRTAVTSSNKFLLALTLASSTHFSSYKHN
uniref:THH1/TOM1/TOM3 domain-containing protein n=1 Tax=Leersia perrieri TaxID=77586 RepID=A0A0D9V5P3_9ORYZ